MHRFPLSNSAAFRFGSSYLPQGPAMGFAEGWSRGTNPQKDETVAYGHSRFPITQRIFHRALLAPSLEKVESGRVLSLMNAAVGERLAF